MIGRRDVILLKAHLLLLVVLFAPLLLRPSSAPANAGDLWAYHYPLRHLAASTIQEGRLPLWNPHIFAGVPLAANTHAQLFYPLAPLHRVLPLGWSFTWDAFIHLALALAGAYLLLRRIGLDPLGAWALSAALGLSPFLSSRVAQGVPTILSALAWCPWVWLAAGGRPLLLGLALGLQGLSGHPQFALINLAGLLLTTVVRRRGLRSLLEGCAWAAGLCAIQALPTREYLGESVRAVWDARFAAGYSLSFHHLLSYPLTGLLGRGLLGSFEFPSDFFELMVGNIGLIPLLLALGAFGRSWSWVLAAFGLFMALGANNPVLTALGAAIGLDFLRVPGRFSWLVVWGLWLSAAALWPRVRRLLPGKAPALLASLIVLEAAHGAAPWIAPDDPAPFVGANRAVAGALRGPFRHATSPEIASADKAMLMRTFNVTGYESFYPASIARYTAKSERGPAADGSRTYIRDFRTPEMSRLAVRRYVSTDRLGGRPSLVPGAWVYDNPAALPMVQGALSWEHPRPDLWVLRTDGPVVVSQNNYPGWRAWSDGEPLEVRTTDGIFPLLSPPRPGTVIRFRFMPASLAAGLTVTMAVLLAALILTLRRPLPWTS